MPNRPRPRIVRTLATAVLLGTTLAVALSGFGTNPDSASAQQSERAAIAIGFFAAQARGDLDAAVAAFAPNGVFIGARASGACSPITPCTDPAGIRDQIQGNLDIHNCQTVRSVQVAGSVVTGQLEARNDVVRANGIERASQTFLMQIPADRITLFVNVNDMTDAQTLLNAAINAGTQQARVPLPNPATPCGDAAM